jgi:hypothetical protein
MFCPWYRTKGRIRNGQVRLSNIYGVDPLLLSFTRITLFTKRLDPRKETDANTCTFNRLVYIENPKQFHQILMKTWEEKTFKLRSLAIKNGTAAVPFLNKSSRMEPFFLTVDCTPPPGRKVAQLATQTPTEPGVRISRTGLFRNCFTASRTSLIPKMELKV